MDAPHAEVENEDPRPSQRLYKLQIKSTRSTRQTQYRWNIQKDTESSLKRKHTSSDTCGPWRQEHTGVGPDWNLSCPHSRSRDQHSAGGHPREERWAVTPSEGKDPDISGSRKTFIFLWFDLFCSYFWNPPALFFVFSSPTPTPVVIVDFTGLM